MEGAATQKWIVIKITQFGVEDLVLGLEECENSHTLTTTTTGSKKNSQKEANNQTDNQNSALCPPPPIFFTDSWCWMKSSARHTLSIKSVDSNLLRLVNQQVQLKPADMLVINNPLMRLLI